ncbi:MAG TPA: ATP-binding protein [Fervidobacterium sp.]|nr:ATP-binding protein [Fervidobacterium sp.]HPT54275.1 ATP-binding protein [Fervidobacterium sp.]HPZ17309.1 ATP-binding protein [Fervidobacterium sp.]HQE48380.1 ATP-binding protein [Fervidobacterium sp.]HUM42083.1 ATP-binding protein [Fervidobacterium sp.]
MIGKELCNILIEIFESNKFPADSEKITKDITSFIGVDKFSIAIFEQGKDAYRVLLGNYLPLFSKISSKMLDGNNSLSKVVLEETDSTDTSEAYAVKLRYINKEIDQITGAFITNTKPTNLSNFQELMDLLSCFLWLIPSYEKSKVYLEKYRSLWMLTTVFENSQNSAQLLRAFLTIFSDIIEAELIGVVNLSGEEVDILRYVTRKREFERVKLRTSEISDDTMRYFRGSDKVVYKPQGLEEILGSKIMSAMVIPSDIGWFVFANKKESNIYSQTKSFDSMDLDIAKDSINRFLLAKGRIEFDVKLGEEIEKLRRLQSRYELLIEDQKDQIKKMNAVHYISQAIRTMYSVKNVYKALLLGLTSGRLLGYNRALLLVYDDKKDVMLGKAWLGPESDNVENDWKKANQRAMRYSDVVQYLREESMTMELNNQLTQMIENKIFPYKSHPILERCVLRRKIFVANERILNTMGMEAMDLVNLLGTKNFAVIPLVGREGVFGVVIIDNYFTGKPIKESDIEIFKILSDSAGLAVETALNYEELRNKTMSLERQKSLIEYLREFSDSVLQNMSSAIIVLDKEGKVTEWNKKAEMYFERTKEQMMGTELKILGTEFEDIEEMSFQSMRIKEEITLSNYLIQIMGRERYYDIRITPFWDSEKIVLRGVIITLDDVTDRVNLEKERKKQEKLAALGEMAARVAHELRNPISVLGGFIKRLEKNIDVPEARARYVKIISDEILRLEQIVNETLDFSKEPRSLEFTIFNINKLINDVYILMEEKIKEKNILFSFEKDAEEIPVSAEYSRIKQVVINLLQNAIEATPNNGKVLVETRIGLEKIIISFWNEGIPMDKETTDKLFVPFFTTKVYGTGLGLAICKKIIEDEHKGKIYHESTEDGNKFVIELPRSLNDSNI